ncbi:MAG: hypothetical protein RLZZ283_312 [Candidatus Parcubacteria bacterium]|jgi:hypothetical protein
MILEYIEKIRREPIEVRRAAVTFWTTVIVVIIVVAYVSIRLFTALYDPAPVETVPALQAPY